MRHTIGTAKIILFLWALVSFAHPSHANIIAEDASKAVILAYHRIGEDAYPDTNLSTEQFNQHIDILTSGNYTILHLPDILAAWDAGEPLPDNTIAITFEGAFKSSYDNAMQSLIKKDIPFTILYAADSAPEKASTQAYLDKQTLKTLAKNKNITIGILPAQYARHAHKSTTQIQSQINKAISTHQKLFKTTPAIFAYPFGEVSESYKQIIAQNYSFKAALGLNSSVAYNGTDRFELPRFSMTERYGSSERFLLVTQARPIPANDITITDFTISFTTSSDLKDRLDRLNCFISGHNKPLVEQQDDTIIITAENNLQGSRTRLNCTLKETENRQDYWRWFGLLMTGEQTPPHTAAP